MVSSPIICDSNKSLENPLTLINSVQLSTWLVQINNYILPRSYHPQRLFVVTEGIVNKMVKIKRNLKYFRWWEINCIMNLGNDVYFSYELSGILKMRKSKYFKFLAKEGSIVAAISKGKYGKSHNLSWWHLSLSSFWVQSILFLGLRHGNR